MMPLLAITTVALRLELRTTLDWDGDVKWE
jgi:hypothetical protein